MPVVVIKSGARLKSVVTRDATGAVLSEFRPAALGDLRSAIGYAAQPPRPGLGDLVARLAKPIASAIDSATELLLTDEHRTHLGTCSGCSRRHIKLNLLCPDILTCPIIGQLLKVLPSTWRDTLLTEIDKFRLEHPPSPPTGNPSGPII